MHADVETVVSAQESRALWRPLVQRRAPADADPVPSVHTPDLVVEALSPGNRKAEVLAAEFVR